MVRNNDNLSKSATKEENLIIPKQEPLKVGENVNETLPNSVRSLNDKFWNDFRSYLIGQKQSLASVRDKVSYAKRFYHIFQIEDASSLAKLTSDTKCHIMKALAALSKFLGKYDRWLEIVDKFQLKWSSGNKSIEVFRSIFDVENQGNNISIMVKWSRDTLQILPRDYQNIILFNTLTGLRP